MGLRRKEELFVDRMKSSAGKQQAQELGSEFDQLRILVVHPWAITGKRRSALGQNCGLEGETGETGCPRWVERALHLPRWIFSGKGSCVGGY